MRKYDITQPLIVIHVPKAAGISSRKFFEAWYRDRLLMHYFDEAKGKMPVKYDLHGMHSADNPVVAHGHFNRLRQFGVDDYYPEVKQFVTILRDPYELTISSYFYVRKSGSDWKDQTRIPKEDIERHLIATKPNMLNHFPREVTSDNYREIIEKYFVEIGITEHLRTSMRWIAHKLGMPYDDALLGHHNATDRNQEVPVYLRDLFIEKNRLEFDVYNYALKKFLEQGAPPADNAT
ncbi:MAG: hypothetical protein LJE69_05535 [Thiohalocapsa sp.]|uniref:hypothetical protein n=1 Tax=Thiohalocapsa sp. TaxID=2497641 RepID=UPI0025D092F0|nr:hypothetical protein [Thiohalocapsa sp.]MCG6940695.1 hypothetical protein [Thiohalocapsa sp.]